MSFTPLPKAESYKLDGWDVNSWSLSGLVDISSGIALLVKPNAPYGMYAQTSRYAIVLIYTHVVYKDERTNERDCGLIFRSWPNGASHATAQNNNSI